MERGRYLVLWPAYFDSTKSRDEGRRAPRHLCVPNPSPEELLEAAKRLGLRALLEPDKRYPRSWWAKPGRVLVQKHTRKAELIRRIADELRRLRSGTR